MEQFFGFILFCAFIGVVYLAASRRKGGKGGLFGKDNGGARER